MLFKKGDPVKIVHRFKESPSHTGLRYVAHVQEDAQYDSSDDKRVKCEKRMSKAQGK
jgi:hypothetical protein